MTSAALDDDLQTGIAPAFDDLDGGAVPGPPAQKFGEEVEKAICSKITDEYIVSKANQETQFQELDSLIDLLEARRTEKQYDWMSDIRIPEFVSHILTQASTDVSSYFKTRDYVEVYVEDESDEAQASADSAKECINRTLNQRHLYYYHKFVRARMINQLTGRVYAECVWNQKLKRVVYGTEQQPYQLDVDIEGNPITDPDNQLPQIGFEEVEKSEDIPLIDRFNFDILDPRNVFVDNKYTYSLQDKDFVIIRSEKTLSDLRAEELEAGYFNLDLLEEVKTDPETETRQDTYNKEDQFTRPDAEDNPYFDILKRYGKAWCMVDERDPETDLPISAKPGIDENGERMEGATLEEVIMVVALSGGTPTLIAFHATPYVDAEGLPYRPIIRGLCYPHPIYDGGFGDGKHAKELQIAIDDTFNIGMDRTKLATIPTFWIKKFSFDDNDSLYFEPGHPLWVNEPGDVGEFKIQDNIQGTMAQMQVLCDKMQQLTSIYPVTMGRLPAEASTTATAVAGSESRSDARSHFKALTYENTFESELYWMILQMTYQFAKPSTGMKLMGEKVYDFDPTRLYFFKPLSQSTEPEYAKTTKMARIIQLLQTLQPFVPFYANQPQFTAFLGKLMMMAGKYLGDEQLNLVKVLLNPSIPPVTESQGMPETAAPSLADLMGGAASNQNGIPQSPQEQITRETSGAGYGQ